MSRSDRNPRLEERNMTDQEEKGRVNPGAFIIANAIVWGAVILGTSLVLHDARLWAKVFPILGAGAAFSIIFLSPLLLKKKK
jgi:hypothetical protein